MLLCTILLLLPLFISCAPLMTPHMVHIIDDDSLKPTTTTTAPSPTVDNTEWPDGDYCIFSGTSGTCPEHFAHGSIQLAVPVAIGLGEMYRNGKELENYVKVGRVGGVELSMLPYEQIYSLKLSACCRIPTPKPSTPSPLEQVMTELPFAVQA